MIGKDGWGKGKEKVKITFFPALLCQRRAYSIISLPKDFCKELIKTLTKVFVF